LLTFGCGFFGRLGLGRGRHEMRPTPVPGTGCSAPGTGELVQPARVRSAAACGNHSVFVTMDDRVFAFGWNKYGQLGLADGGDEGGNKKRGAGSAGAAAAAAAAASIVDEAWTPQLCRWGHVNAAPVSAAGGARYTLVLAADGSVWSAGDNSVGQLGIGTAKVPGARKFGRVVVPRGTAPAVSITAASAHAAMLTADGQALVWGSAENGRCGGGLMDRTLTRGTCARFAPAPIAVPGPVVSLSLGSRHTILVVAGRGDQEGPRGVAEVISLWGFGFNKSGQLTVPWDAEAQPIDHLGNDTGGADFESSANTATGNNDDDNDDTTAPLEIGGRFDIVTPRLLGRVRHPATRVACGGSFTVFGFARFADALAHAAGDDDVATVSRLLKDHAEGALGTGESTEAASGGSGTTVCEPWADDAREPVTGFTALHRAAHRGAAAGVAALLRFAAGTRSGVAPWLLATDARARTPLMVACAAGSWPCAMQLLAATQPTYRADPPLFAAPPPQRRPRRDRCVLEHAATTSSSLSSSSITSSSTSSSSANGDARTPSLTITSLTGTDADGRTALHLAVDGMVSMCACPSSRGQSAMMMTTRDDDNDILPAEIDGQPRADPGSARIAIVGALLASGACASARDAAGQTALHLVMARVATESGIGIGSGIGSMSSDIGSMSNSIGICETCHQDGHNHHLHGDFASFPRDVMREAMTPDQSPIAAAFAAAARGFASFVAAGQDPALHAPGRRHLKAPRHVLAHMLVSPGGADVLIEDTGSGSGDGRGALAAAPHGLGSALRAAAGVWEVAIIAQRPLAGSGCLCAFAAADADDLAFDYDGDSGGGGGDNGGDAHQQQHPPPCNRCDLGAARSLSRRVAAQAGLVCGVLPASAEALPDGVMAVIPLLSRELIVGGRLRDLLAGRTRAVRGAQVPGRPLSVICACAGGMDRVMDAVAELERVHEPNDPVPDLLRGQITDLALGEPDRFDAAVAQLLHGVREIHLPWSPDADLVDALAGDNDDQDSDGNDISDGDGDGDDDGCADDVDARGNQRSGGAGIVAGAPRRHAVVAEENSAAAARRRARRAAADLTSAAIAERRREDRALASMAPRVHISAEVKSGDANAPRTTLLCALALELCGAGCRVTGSIPAVAGTGKQRVAAAATTTTTAPSNYYKQLSRGPETTRALAASDIVLIVLDREGTMSQGQLEDMARAEAGSNTDAAAGGPGSGGGARVNAGRTCRAPLRLPKAAQYSLARCPPIMCPDIGSVKCASGRIADLARCSMLMAKIEHG
jgi:hypothetical protein